MPRSYTPAPPDDAALQLAGKAYGIQFSFWKKFFNILADGPAFVTIANPSYLSGRDRELREDYQNLLSINPQLHDILSRKPADEAAKLLTSGRDRFRNSQVHEISKAIPLWPTGYNIPPSKTLRGFSDDICGGLLCPPLHDWDDLSVRRDIQNHKIVFEADDFPSFLWEGETANMQDLKKGFLRGGILVHTMLSILLGPAVAEKGEGSGAGGYADLFNMRSMTVPAIAFGAAIARHALTTDSNFTWTTNKGRFSHLCFYHEIIKAVSGWSETEQKQLVEWWNGRVLSRLRGSSRSMSLSNDPRPNSTAALMHQQQHGA